MYLGKIVEIADVDDSVSESEAPVYRGAAVRGPVADPDFVGTRIRLKGDAPSPMSPPSGCPFPPALRLRDRAMQRRNADDAPGRARTRRELSPRR